MARRRKEESPRARVSLYVSSETSKQLKMLSEIFNVSAHAIVAQAVARWFHTEPLVKSKKKEAASNGADHSGVQD